MGNPLLLAVYAGGAVVLLRKAQLLVPGILAVAVAVAVGCKTTPPPVPVVDRGAPQGEGTRPAEPVQDDARCGRHGPVHRVVLSPGQTAETPDGLLVTYEGSMHDQYEDGTTDELLVFRFQSLVAPDQRPSESALQWLPSAFAPPVFVYMSTGDCVRIVDVPAPRVTLEIAESQSPPP